MKERFINQAVLAILLICQFSVCLAIETPDANESSRYLDAVRTFADNVLKYGRDTYGPKHTPLFVDGLNIHTHEPVKWISPEGEKWILSNLASQQNLFRTLDGLTRITGDQKYKQAAMDAIKYAFENLRSPNGLLYWGGHIAYDVLGEHVCARGPSNNHELKYHFPYYELMWHVDPKATQQFIESFWSAHIIDWLNLDMNRHGHTERTLDTPWDNKYKGGSVFFWGRGLTFINTGSDLFYAAAVLSKLSGEKQPLVWGKRMAYRYVETRNPKTGIGGYQYSQCKTAWCCGPSILGDRAQYQFGDDFKGHFVVEGTLFPCYGGTPAVQPRICEFLLGEMLGAQGKQFTQWALEELTAWGKVAYRKEDNSFIPMLTDGTSMEGYVCKKDGYFGPKGRVLKAGRAGPLVFWAYAMAYRITGDTFMRQMARNIAGSNGFGDIGADLHTALDLNMDTDCSRAHMLLGFLELYNKEKHAELLEIAKKIGDNILAERFHKRFFVPSNEHIYARFDDLNSLALLHLDAAVKAQPSPAPWVWPSSSFLACEYYGRGTAYDTSLIYGLTDSAEPPMTPRVAAAVGDLARLRSLLSKENSKTKDRQATLNNIFRLGAESGHAHIVEYLLAEGAEINSGTTTALHYAVEKGHRAVVELLLSMGADVNARDGANQTPVDLAARRNRTHIIKLLVEKGATISTIHLAASLGNIEKVTGFIEDGVDVNAKNKNGQAPLELAVYGEHTDVVKSLIEKGANVNAKDKWGYTPLYYAIWNEDANMVKLLVDKGADVNVLPDDDGTPLEYAVWNEDVEMAKLFVDRGAKFDVKDNDGWTAFRYAVSAANRELVEFFVSKGADVSSFHGAACVGDLARVKGSVEKGTDVDIKDEMDWTALYWAASTGQEDVAEFLIDKGADVGARAEDSSTLSHQAARAGALRLVKLLITKGADVNVKDKRGNTSLHAAASRGHRQVVELLIANGADVNAKNQNNWTPLHRAAIAGHKGIVEILIAHGADVTIKDRRGRTPLYWAKQRDHTEVVNLLLNNKANISAALLSAAQSGDKEFVEQLLDLGADVKVQDKLGLTPLHIAASRQDKEIIALLLAHNAKVNAQDKAGRLPLHYAVGARHPWWEPKDEDVEAAVLLLNHGANVNTPDKEGKTPLYYSVRLGKKMTELLLNRGANPNYVDPRGEKPLPPKHGHTFYVATVGDDSNFGTKEHPFRTVNTAIMAARPGDTIYVRGRTHSYSHTILIEKSGKLNKPIRLSAYPGEIPVFDFSSAPGIGFLIRGAYWHIKGIVITKSGTEGLALTGEGAHHNIVEQVVSHSTGRTGITVHTKAAQNLILNCDAYRNFDFLGNGENADGFEVKFSAGIGNILIGNRSWNNADDGYDLWYAGNSVRLESCYAWRNGENLWSHPFFTGNANGFKLGQMEGAHLLIRCAAWDHPMRGFDLNGNSTGVTLFNCTAFQNNINFAFTFSKGNIEKNVLRNNLSSKGLVRINRVVDDQFNSWNMNPGTEISEQDFVSLDDSIFTGPRNPDGSIPNSDFLRLAPGSAAIDKGVDVNIPYTGKAPDLGAFEYDPNETSEDYVKMLHQAVRDHDIKQIEQLLAQGEGINKKDWLGYTPLHWACYFDYPDLVELLIGKGADHNLISDTGRTPLKIAEAMDYELIVDLLSKHDAKK